MSRFISNDEILHRGKFAPKPAVKVTVTPEPVAPVEVKAETVIEPEVKEETKIEAVDVAKDVTLAPAEENVAEDVAEPEVVMEAAEENVAAPADETPKPKKAPAKKKSTTKATEE